MSLQWWWRRWWWCNGFENRVVVVQFIFIMSTFQTYYTTLDDFAFITPQRDKSQHEHYACVHSLWSLSWFPCSYAFQTISHHRACCCMHVCVCMRMTITIKCGYLQKKFLQKQTLMFLHFTWMRPFNILIHESVI